jgi:8-oxo-dGTP pyrophosphatase MutT (NUDIX family)
MAGHRNILAHLKPREKLSPHVKERRWSPPKGGPVNHLKETIKEVIQREVREETGLFPNQYRILDLPPIELSYTSGDNAFFISLELFFAILNPDVTVRRYDEETGTSTKLAPVCTNEVERVANVPLEKLSELYPLEYGPPLVEQILKRLSADKKLTREVAARALLVKGPVVVDPALPSPALLLPPLPPPALPAPSMLPSSSSTPSAWPPSPSSSLSLLPITHTLSEFLAGISFFGGKSALLASTSMLTSSPSHTPTVHASSSLHDNAPTGDKSGKKQN